MKPIRSINIKDLTNDLHFQFLKNVIDLAAPVAVPLKFDATLALLRQAFEAEDAVLPGIRRSSYTKPKLEADRARSRLYRGMVLYTRAALLHFDATVRQSAQRVMTVFDTYGKVAAMGLYGKTSAIYNLLQELRGERFGADVAAIGLTAWADALEASNQATQALERRQYDEYADRSPLTMRAAREQSDEAYRRLVKHLEVLIAVEGAAPYADLTARLNGCIGEYRELIARARKRREG